MIEMNDQDFEEWLEIFMPMIRNKLKNTSFQEREDLEQELKIKIHEKADMLLCQDAPGFWEFVADLVNKL